MDFFNLYKDDSGDDAAERPTAAAHDSDDTDSSDASSEDSAEVRQREAQARLRDFGDAEATTSSALPSAFEAFNEVAKPPSFLDPEATRALASAAHHGRPDAAAASEETSTSWHGPKGRIPPGEKFDIARLAPPLKGAPRTGQDKRGVPYAAIIEGKAKRAKHDEAPGPSVSAAQIAMLGGTAPEQKAAAAPTPAMGVAEFLEKGVGGAQLPRQRQERKDKEKAKRALGQSSIGSWKSEAEMVLRQQYD